MENKGNFLAGLAIMAGLIVLGLCIPSAVKVIASLQRSVNVRGLCERELPADKVIWPLKYTIAGDNLSAVYSQIESYNASIVSFLKAGGIEDSEISFGTPQISDKLTSDYVSDSRVYRYIANSTITVCTGKIDIVLSLMNSQKNLVKKGIVLAEDWESRAVFSFEGLNEVKPQMIEEATKNARESAQKFADDSGSRLGKIRNATQGYFTIEDRDSNTPHIKKVRVVTNVTYSLKR